MNWSHAAFAGLLGWLVGMLGDWFFEGEMPLWLLVFLSLFLGVNAGSIYDWLFKKRKVD